MKEVEIKIVVETSKEPQLQNEYEERGNNSRLSDVSSRVEDRKFYLEEYVSTCKRFMYYDPNRSHLQLRAQEELDFLNELCSIMRE